uniref:Aminotransferase class I/classII large domain-containing protein n=1 Tax=Haptolina brevifila TaxID=156173 RepID=A0A7S2DJ65_9EUKA|mmetsp:Transcript_39188/g.78347  ORF Transcript_39188/g.78347 Transcript_39188/m.78347 type:complete len:191 (+) Transcript_39188:67-639(+)|eukprot:CAMPEP_0174732356 /NCGR_PEP_ID=MMETSP1094-20130205/59254_1 /TAXON_ID=156173 /ORGANISM="Chrysochromulina brevifilum, Strain UTEX LB 985" /LENGTH=190 /DNA_ID=CAMNT_0015934861 /DNA_START=66 /DNA_END=638 /DNA_ORIENTATION=+
MCCSPKLSQGGACFSMVPATVQRAVTEILSDHAFCESFLSTSRQMLGRNYHLLTQHLDEAGVTYVAATGGLFFCLDLRRALPPGNPSFEEEFQLFEELCDAGVVITPGSDFDAPFPGLFRVCPYSQEMSETDSNACFAAFAERVARVVEARTKGQGTTTFKAVAFSALCARWLTQVECIQQGSYQSFHST